MVEPQLVVLLETEVRPPDCVSSPVWSRGCGCTPMATWITVIPQCGYEEVIANLEDASSPGAGALQVPHTQGPAPLDIERRIKGFSMHTKTEVTR